MSFKIALKINVFSPMMTLPLFCDCSWRYHGRLNRHLGGRRQSPSDAPGYIPKLNVSSTTRAPFSPLTIPRKMENGHNSLMVRLLGAKCLKSEFVLEFAGSSRYTAACHVHSAPWCGAALTVCHFLKGCPSVSIVPGVAVNPVRWSRSRSWSL